MTGSRTSVIAGVLHRPVLDRPTVGAEARGRMVQGLAPRSSTVDWTATVPQLAEAIDTALALADAPAHALVVDHRGGDLVGTCACGRVLGRIRPGTRLDALAVPWMQHASPELAAAGHRA
ncbi:hypothetical protein ACIP96_06490 [Streptomyces nigra]|uniref:hypothetical protein n=1 Tax=Streptomyces nigra TaxID=1827580 RepID=UPI0038179A76